MELHIGKGGYNPTSPLLRNSFSGLTDEAYSLSGRSDHTLVSNQSEQTLFGGEHRAHPPLAHSQQGLNTPSAWEAMYKLADARLAAAAADQEKAKNWRLNQLAGGCLGLADPTPCLLLQQAASSCHSNLAPSLQNFILCGFASTRSVYLSGLKFGKCVCV